MQYFIVFIFVPSVIFAHNLSEEQKFKEIAQEKHYAEVEKAKKELVGKEKHHRRYKKAKEDLKEAAFAASVAFTAYKGLDCIIGPGTLDYELRNIFGDAIVDTISLALIFGTVSIVGYAVYKGFTGFKHLIDPDHPNLENKSQ
jgi:hypothetical protein